MVDRARAGDRKAFEILVARYRDRIYSLCYSKLGSTEDALDATQDVFLRAYRAIERFEGKSQFYTWLFRIAINCAYTRRKRRKSRRDLHGLSLDQLRASEAGGDSIELADERNEPSRAAQRAERMHAIHEAIRALPNDYQQIVTLRDLQGFSYQEIGETLDMPIGSVKSRLHRARLQLRDRLRRYFDGRS